MKTATVRELRNDFARLSRLLAEGEPIAITKRGSRVAVLSPYRPAGSKRVKLPDFIARMKQYMSAPLPAGTSQSIIDYDRGDR